MNNSTNSTSPYVKRTPSQILARLDAAFPDNGDGTFNAAWKNDVANHPEHYSKILAQLDTLLSASTNQPTGH